MKLPKWLLQLCGAKPNRPARGYADWVLSEVEYPGGPQVCGCRSQLLTNLRTGKTFTLHRYCDPVIREQACSAN